MGPRLIVAFLFLSVCSVNLYAQSTTKRIVNESNLKLAHQLLKAYDYDRSVRKAVLDLNEKLKADLKDIKSTDPKAHVYLESNKNYDAQKEKTIQQTLDEMAIVLVVQLTDVEMKYLIELANNSLNKKFMGLIKSDDFVNASKLPYSKFGEIMRQSKEKFKAESVKPKK